MKFSFRKTRPATHTCEHSRRVTDLVQERYDERLAERAKAEQAKADLLARLLTRYYAASALIENSFSSGRGGNSHQIGVASGLSDAIAEVLDLNTITTNYRLTHGLSMSEDETCVVDGGEIPVILRKDTDRREPVTERLARLHAEALKATGHPMYEVLYGKVPA